MHRLSPFCALALAACAATHRPSDPDAPAGRDAGTLADVPRDTARRDAPPDAPPRRGFYGTPCVDGACVDGSSCGGVWVTVEALDGTTRRHDLRAGVCTRRCDPAESASDCSCATEMPFGAGHGSVLDAEGRGVCTLFCEGEARWWPLGVPMPPCATSCATDADCQFVPISIDPPIFREIEPTVAIRCELGRCEHFHATGPELGTPCESDLDCAAEHRCSGLPGTCVETSSAW